MRAAVLLVAWLAACGGKHATTTTTVSNQAPPAKAVEPPPAQPEPVATSGAALPDCGAHPEMACTLRSFDQLVDETCACTSSDCVSAVNVRLTAWAEELSKNASASTVQPTTAETKHMTDSAMRMSDCMTKILSAPPAAQP